MQTDPSLPPVGVTTAEPVPLALVPAWRRPVFWLLFAFGAWWGAVLGSAAVGNPFIWRLIGPDIGPAATQRFLDDALFGTLAKLARTQLGATVIVWTFSLGSAFLVSMWGLRRLRRSEPGGSWSRGEP